MIALLIALAAAAQSDWPTYHGGYSLEGVSSVAPPDAPEKLWSFRADHRIDVTPIVGGGRVFVATSKGTLHALDLDGRKLWDHPLGKKVTPAPPLYVDGLVVVGTSEGILHAVEAESGKTRWTYPIKDDTIQGTANVVDLPGGRRGIVVIAQSEGVIHCVDLETGRLSWKTEPVERCDGSAGVGSGKVVMGSCAAALHLYSIKTRGEPTNVELGNDSQVAGGVAVADGVAYAGTRSGSLCAVNLTAGELLWTNRDNRSEAFATPAVSGTRVVFAGDDGKIYALNRKTGVKIWRFDAGRNPGSPVIAGNRVVVTGNGTLHLLNLETGREVWKREVSDAVTSPALSEGRILVGADDGTVVLYGKK